MARLNHILKLSWFFIKANVLSIQHPGQGNGTQWLTKKLFWGGLYTLASIDRGIFNFVFVLSVWLFVCAMSTLTIAITFWVVRDRDFIFGMHTALMMHFQTTPSSMTLWPWLWPLYLKIAIWDFIYFHWGHTVSQTHLVFFFWGGGGRVRVFNADVFKNWNFNANLEDFLVSDWDFPNPLNPLDPPRTVRPLYSVFMRHPQGFRRYLRHAARIIPLY